MKVRNRVKREDDEGEAALEAGNTRDCGRRRRPFAEVSGTIFMDHRELRLW